MFFGGRKKDICIYFLVYEGEIIIVKVIFFIEIFILFFFKNQKGIVIKNITISIYYNI